MHIAQVANFYGPVSGGIRTTMRELGRGYVARGHRSTIVVPGSVDRTIETDHGTIVELASPRIPGAGGYRVITDVDRVCTVLHDVAPDRIELSDRLTLRSLGWWARSQGIPTAMWAHERVDGVLRTWLPGPWPVTALADRWNRTTVERFDTVVCSTWFARQEFERIGHLQVAMVPLGVDLVTFHPGRRDAGVRASYLAPGGDALLVMASRLSKEKRVDVAIDAVRRLAVRGIEARLVIAGEGPERASLERRAAGLPVTFLGHLSSRTEVADLLAAADVVLAPGPIETFCLAALESLASGTPVVASSASAVGEVVGTGSSRTAPSQPDAFAAAIAAVLGSDERSRRAAARARAERYPWSRTVASMLELHGAEPLRRATSV